MPSREDRISQLWHTFPMQAGSGPPLGITPPDSALGFFLTKSFLSTEAKSVKFSFQWPDQGQQNFVKFSGGS